MTDLGGRSVLLMGLGRFGGGVGAARWLAAQGAHVVVTDLADAEALAAPLERLRPEIDAGRVSLRLGGHREEDFAAADLVVANPAVPRPWENPYLAAAARAGRQVTTEIRLLVERLDRRRVIGVTGSAGKSTTSAMTAHILRGLGQRVHLGGNIGGSLLESLPKIDVGDWVVLELSSFMLHWLGEAGSRQGTGGWSPGVAVVTNIQPNHLDWHGAFEHYRHSKLGILRWQQEGDAAVLGDVAELAGITSRAAPATTAPAPGAVEQATHGLLGGHNRENARLAVRAAVAASGCDPTEAAAALAGFAGLPHRLEVVAEIDGRRFVNDSKSTTPEAALRAIEAFDDPRRVHLIAGGYDKGVDLAPLARAATELAGLYAIGATGRALAQAARGRYEETLERAVQAAVGRMRPGDVLLLSPGCASWDQFENFEARGDAFRRLVAALRRD